MLKILFLLSVVFVFVNSSKAQAAKPAVKKLELAEAVLGRYIPNKSDATDEELEKKFQKLHKLCARSVKREITKEARKELVSVKKYIEAPVSAAKFVEVLTEKVSKADTTSEASIFIIIMEASIRKSIQDDVRFMHYSTMTNLDLIQAQITELAEQIGIKPKDE